MLFVLLVLALYISHTAEIMLFGFISLFLTLQLAASLPANVSTDHFDQNEWFQGASLSKRISTLPERSQYYYKDAFGEYTLHNVDSRSPRLLKRAAGDVERQSTDRPEMKFISQPKNSDLNNIVDYAYINYAGKGVTVYVHDTGINLANVEFTGALPESVTRGTIEWLLPEKDQAGNPFPNVDSDTIGHGTCVASKAVGVNFGVAKSANLKMIPLYDADNANYVLAGLQAILDDITNSKTKPEFAVINLSYSLDETDERDNLDKYRDLYQKLVDTGALLVVTAGNGGQKPVDTYPALFAQEDSFKNNMLVVGAVDVLGNPATFSQNGPLVDAWAPGTVDTKNGIKCAAKQGENTSRDGKGTSYAAPQFAGLAAYYYSTDSTLRGDGAAGKIKAHIKQYDYARIAGGVDAIYNREIGTDTCDVD